MWISFGKSTVTLDAKQTLALKHARGMEVTCVEGVIWLSTEGDARDILLTPGRSFTLATNGLTVMEGMPHATIRLERRASWPQNAVGRLIQAALARWQRPAPQASLLKAPHASIGSP